MEEQAVSCQLFSLLDCRNGAAEVAFYITDREQADVLASVHKHVSRG